MNLRTATALAVLAMVAMAAISPAAGLESKMLGGPPSEFKRHEMPDSSLGALFQSSATHFMTLQQVAGTSDVWSYETDVVVDSSQGFQMSLMSPLLEHLEPSLTDPNGNSVDLASHESKVKQRRARAREEGGGRNGQMMGGGVTLPGAN